MAEKINLQRTMQNKITNAQWPYLQQLAKIVHEHLIKCSKNREYAQAQKAKDKIQEINVNIQKRNAHNVEQKFDESITKLQTKQIKQKDNYIMEWESKMSAIEKTFEESYQRKIKFNEEQKMKLKQQLELALPVSHSPDDKLKQLRHEQKKLANQGNFVQAQNVKNMIEDREIMLSQKHKKLRQNNIDSMLKQTQQKHEKDLQQRQKQRKHVLQEMIKQKNKKLKEMQERHTKQLKQAKWMFQEEVRIVTGH